MAMLGFKTNVKGPAPPFSGEEDVIDEAMKYFRANVLFASFEIEGGADRTLVYLTNHILQCLWRLDQKAKTLDDAKKIMFDFAHEQFPMPGETGWQFGGHIPKPKTKAEGDEARAYLKQLREETGNRVAAWLFASGEKDKHIAMFAKRRFLGMVGSGAAGRRGTMQQ